MTGATRRGDAVTGYTCVAATVGANSAAGYQLAGGDAVMAIAGVTVDDLTA
jgi:hypothetical protein